MHDGPIRQRFKHREQVRDFTALATKRCSQFVVFFLDIRRILIEGVTQRAHFVAGLHPGAGCPLPDRQRSRHTGDFFQTPGNARGANGWR